MTKFPELKTPKVSKIFYDGNCIVCDMEISHYKRILPSAFELVDISSADFDAKRFNLSNHAVEKDLHVMTSEGVLKVGIDAFAHIWSQIPRYRFLAKFSTLPGIHWMMKVSYRVFTFLRPWLPKKMRQ